MTAAVPTIVILGLATGLALPAFAQISGAPAGPAAAGGPSRPRVEFGASITAGRDSDGSGRNTVTLIPRVRISTTPWTAIEGEAGWTGRAEIVRPERRWAAALLARDVHTLRAGRVFVAAGVVVVSERRRFPAFPGGTPGDERPASEFRETTFGAQFGGGVRNIVAPWLAVRGEARLTLSESLPLVSGSVGFDVPIGRYARPSEVSAADTLPASHPFASIRHGRRVWVTTADGREEHGEWVEATTAGVTVDTPRGRTSIAMSLVARVETPDSLRNGFTVGIVTGAASGGALGGLLATALCETDSCGPAVVFGLAGIGAAVGTVGGVLIDSAVARRRSVFDVSQPGRAVRVMVAPVIARGGWGLASAVRW